MTDPYSLESLDYNQILGAQGGGQNLSDLMEALAGTLQKGGYFGADYTKSGAQESLSDLGYGQYTTEWGKGAYSDQVGDMYGLSGVTGLLEEQFGEGVITDPSKKQEGMQSLLKLLQSLNIPGMQKEYGQNVGDVQSEIGSQLQSLIKGRTIGSKSGRYGSIGSGGRNIGAGGRNKYMSDYYGLQEKQFTMQQDLQKQMEEDLNLGVGQYMQLNRAPGL
jgi:hypothetical protein